jgi:hypothetical protein
MFENNSCNTYQHDLITDCNGNTISKNEHIAGLHDNFISQNDIVNESNENYTSPNKNLNNLNVSQDMSEEYADDEYEDCPDIVLDLEMIKNHPTHRNQHSNNHNKTEAKPVLLNSKPQQHVNTKNLVDTKKKQKNKPITFDDVVNNNLDIYLQQDQTYQQLCKKRDALLRIHQQFRNKQQLMEVEAYLAQIKAIKTQELRQKLFYLVQAMF